MNEIDIRTNNIDLMNMAIDMLRQSISTQESLNSIYEKLEIKNEDSTYGKQSARFNYQIIRGCVGLLEINTDQIKILSTQDIINNNYED